MTVGLCHKFLFRFTSESKYVPLTFLKQHLSLSFDVSSIQHFLHASFPPEINKEFHKKKFMSETSVWSERQANTKTKIIKNKVEYECHEI